MIERELSLLQPDVRRDPARLLAVLHDQFEEYGASGLVWDRLSILEATAQSAGPIRATDIRAHRLAPDTFLVTYRSAEAGRQALRSSIWLREGGEWLLRFHQGTPYAADRAPLLTHDVKLGRLAATSLDALGAPTTLEA